MGMSGVVGTCIAYDSLGDVDRAIECYEQALKIAREIGNVKAESALLINLGNTYTSLDNGQHAIEYFEQALKIASELGDRWYHALGNYQQAIDDFSRAIELDPHLAWAYTSRGAVYRYLGDEGLAMRDLNYAVELENLIEQPQQPHGRHMSHRGLATSWDFQSNYRSSLL